MKIPEKLAKQTFRLFLGYAYGLAQLFIPIDTKSVEKCCSGSNLKSCINVEVDPTALDSLEDISVEGKHLFYSNSVPPNAKVYKSIEGIELAFLNFVICDEIIM